MYDWGFFDKKKRREIRRSMNVFWSKSLSLTCNATLHAHTRSGLDWKKREEEEIFSSFIPSLNLQIKPNQSERVPFVASDSLTVSKQKTREKSPFKLSCWHSTSGGKILYKQSEERDCVIPFHARSFFSSSHLSKADKKKNFKEWKKRPKHIVMYLKKKEIINPYIMYDKRWTRIQNPRKNIF